MNGGNEASTGVKVKLREQAASEQTFQNKTASDVRSGPVKNKEPTEKDEMTTQSPFCFIDQCDACIFLFDFFKKYILNLYFSYVILLFRHHRTYFTST